MMSDDAKVPDEFVERVARPLRSPEKVDGTFQARVMSAVHADQRATASSWRRPFTVRLTVPMALAAAAVFAAVVLAAESGLRHLTSAPSSVAAQKTDTIMLVRFVFTDAGARSVSLVGSFNQWRRDATPLRVDGVAGTWTVSVPLRAGRHEYAFIVSDGTRERWIADPAVPTLLDQHGTESSILSLGTLD